MSVTVLELDLSLKRRLDKISSKPNFQFNLKELFCLFIMRPGKLNSPFFLSINFIVHLISHHGVDNFMVLTASAQQLHIIK